MQWVESTFTFTFKMQEVWKTSYPVLRKLTYLKKATKLALKEGQMWNHHSEVEHLKEEYIILFLRYMAGILPIRRKTLKQSINQLF